MERSRTDTAKHNSSALNALTAPWMFIIMLGLFLGFAKAASVTQREQQAGDQCIMCHVETYNSTLLKKFSHPPFFDRQCTACHLQPGSNWPDSSHMMESSDISGTLATQDLLWRKQQRYNGELRTAEHVVNLDNLDSSLGYRFRLAVGEQPTTALARSLWLRLDSRQLWNRNSRELTTANGLSGEIGEQIDSLTITAISSDQVMVSWTTDQSMFSWLELQDLAGLDSAGAVETASASKRKEHPPLRRADDLAIDACDHCHPETSLGASHPVRLYGNREVRIPAELPTADGMLTCVTCHTPHGGGGKNLQRTKDKTHLCVTCHAKYKNSSPSTMFRD